MISLGPVPLLHCNRLLLKPSKKLKCKVMMKHLFVVGMTLITLLANQQSYGQQTDSTTVVTTPVQDADAPRRFNLLVGLGIAAPSHYGGLWLAQAAPVVFIEPQYRLGKHWNLGLRLEYAFLTKYRATYNNFDLDNGIVKAPAIPSIALFLDYHFKPNQSGLKPFIGVGLGRFSRGTGELLADKYKSSKNIALGSCPGIVPRIGLSSARLAISAEANILWENYTTGPFITWWGKSGDYRGRGYTTLKVAYKF